MNNLLSDYIRENLEFPSDSNVELIKSKNLFLKPDRIDYNEVLKAQAYIDQIDKAAEILALLYGEHESLALKNDIAIMLIRASIAQKTKELKFLSNQFESILLSFTSNNSLITLIKEEYNSSILEESNVDYYNGVTLAFTDNALTGYKKDFKIFSTNVLKQSGSLDSFPIEVSLSGPQTSYIEFTYNFNGIFIDQLFIDLQSYSGQEIIIYVNGNLHSRNIIDRKNNLFPIGDDCLEIKFQIIDQTGYYYIDNIEFKSLESQASGYVVTGPYVLESTVNQFLINPCVTTTNNSSVSFKYSFDNENWNAIDGQEVVYFNNFSEIAGTKIDEEAIYGAAIKPTTIQLAANEYILNAKFGTKGNFLIKRNLNNQTLDINGIPAGWRLDFSTMRYITYLDVKSPFDIDINGTSIYMNDIQYQDFLSVPIGIQKFSIDSIYWNDVPELIDSEEEFIASDPLYGSNLKLLIEGYHYHSNYNGTKIYPEKREIFSYIMSPGELVDESLYTLYFDNEFYYLKILNNNNETFDIQCLNDTIESNELYIKTNLYGNENEIPFSHYFELKAI